MKLAGQAGYTLMELLIAMVLAMVVIMMAFSLLEFTTSDVSNITDRAHVDQVGRVALENIMLQLHSSCVAATVIPIQSESTTTKLRFVSEAGTEPALKKVHLHEIIYTPATETTEGTLAEKIYASTNATPPFKFESTYSNIKLLTGISQTGSTPVFQYYRYYEKGDKTPVYGQINETPMSGASTSGGLSEAEAEKVTKVTVGFTVSPEGKTGIAFSKDRASALEDSVVFRVAPSSQEEGAFNAPCE
jgi:hypothetical protein